MRIIAIALPFAALLATSGAALAADTFSGEVTSMNQATGDIGLETGQHFRVSDPVLLRGYIPGEHVIVTKNDDSTVGIAEDSGYLDTGAPVGP